MMPSRDWQIVEAESAISRSREVMARSRKARGAVKQSMAEARQVPSGMWLELTMA